MAVYDWTGAIDTSAANPNNWLLGGVVPGSAPTNADTMQFTTGVPVIVNICVLDIPALGSINHQHNEITLVFGGAGITAHELYGTFHHNGPVGISNSSTGVITVEFNNATSATGDIIYFPQKFPIWFSSQSSAATTIMRSSTIPNLKFKFNTTNPPCLPHGIYPTVEVLRDVLPHYSINESEVTLHPEVDFYDLITTNTGSFKEANAGIFQTDPIKEIDKTFRVRSFTMALKNSFEGGKGHWIFHAAGTVDVKELPLSGTGRQTYGSGTVNKLENITIVPNSRTGDNQQSLPPGNHYLKKLTVAEGVRLRTTRGVTELHIASRPNIRGSWQFYAISDGVYRSKKSSMIQPLDTGGTNTRIYTSFAIPFVNDTLPYAAFLDMGQGSTFNFNPTTQTLTVGTGGIQFNDGTIQTTAATGGGGGGSALTIQDEGSSLLTAATTLNFVDGQHLVQTLPNPQPFAVEATGAGPIKTITIDGSKVRTNATDTLPAYLDAKLGAGANMNITLNTAASATVGNNFVFSADNNKVKISSADTTEDFLENKLTAGANITLTKLTLGGNETLVISSSGGGGGGGGGYPLFKHDQNPTSNNFSPFRLLQDQDTIELGVTSGGDDNADVSVFTPVNTENPVVVDIIDIGSHATNTGREYMFFGQDDRMGLTEYQTFNSGSPNTPIPIFFVESMRDVASGMVASTRLRIYPASRDTRLNNVRVMDAGKHEAFMIDPNTGEPTEEPMPVRILLIVDYQQLHDRGRWLMNNYELRM